MAFDGVEDGPVVKRELLHVVTGTIHGLLNGSGDFTGLALAHANTAFAITHNRESGERQDTAALDDLGDAVNRNHLLAEAVISSSRILTLKLSHCAQSLELETGFARGLGQRSNAAVITVSGTVESAGFNASRLRLFSDAGANDLGCIHVAAVALSSSQLVANFTLNRGGRNEHAAAVGADDARVDVQVGTMDRKTIHLLQLDAGTRSTRATLTAFLFVNHIRLAYFFLVSFRITTSFSYRMPLPL